MGDVGDFELFQEILGGDKECTDAPLTGFNPDGDGEMGFAYPWGAHKQDIFGFLYELEV